MHKCLASWLLSVRSLHRISSLNQISYRGSKEFHCSSVLHGCQNKADPCRILAASSAAARCKIGLGKIKLANHSLVSSNDVTVMSLSTLYIVTLLVLQRATLSSFNWNLVALLRGSQICFLALSHWGLGPLFLSIICYSQ